jgi:hypothetical protein
VYGLLGGTDPSNFVLLTDQGTRYVGQLYRGEKNSTSIAGMIREGVNAARDIMVTVRKSKSGEDLRTVEFRPGEQEFKLVFWPEEKGSFKADDWTFRVINLRNQDETSLGELVIPKPR